MTSLSKAVWIYCLMIFPLAFGPSICLAKVSEISLTELVYRKLRKLTTVDSFINKNKAFLLEEEVGWLKTKFGGIKESNIGRNFEFKGEKIFFGAYSLKVMGPNKFRINGKDFQKKQGEALDMFARRVFGQASDVGLSFALPRAYAFAHIVYGVLALFFGALTLTFFILKLLGIEAVCDEKTQRCEFRGRASRVSALKNYCLAADAGRHSEGIQILEEASGTKISSENVQSLESAGGCSELRLANDEQNVPPLVPLDNTEV